MTASKCIRGKGASGTVDKDRADAAADLFDEQLIELRHRNSPNPEEIAGQRVFSALEHRKRVNRRAAVRQMMVQERVRQFIDSADDPVEGALALLDFDPSLRAAGQNVHTTGNAIRGQVHARMSDFLETFRSRAAGLDGLSPRLRERRRVALRDMVFELFGENTGSTEAKKVARAVAEGFEFQRNLANASGMTIPKRADWGLPQSHSRRAVNSVTKDEWTEFTLDRLDRSKMIDVNTGQPFTDAGLRRTLGEVYEDIVTNGLRDVKPGGGVGRSIAVKRSHARFLIFKGAKNWLDYQAKFGEGNAFDAILGHVNGLSRDIALMRILGPNPDATIRFMEDVVGQKQGRSALEQTGKKGARAAARIAKGQPAIKDLYAVVSGNINKPGNEFWSNVSGGNRNVLSAAMLGGAFFSAIADRTFSDITSRLNGIPAMKVMARHLKMFAPGSKNDHRLAVQTGFVADHWAGVAIAEQRYLGEVIGPEWTQRFSDTILRASFLSPWTTSGRSAFQLEFLGFLTRNADKRFEQLPNAFRLSLENHGITEGDWSVIRATKPWKDDRSGAEFIRPQDIIGAVEDAGPLFEQRFEIGNKLQSMILDETEMAVPSVTPRARAILTFGAQPGTFVGEIARNVMFLKSFPVTLAMTQLNRAVRGNISGAQRAKYFAHLIIGTAVMGTLGEQMSQISKGKDPLPMDPTTEEGKQTLFKGLTRGGGLGLFGDFIFGDINRYGGGIENTLLGPVFGSQVPQVFKLTAGNLQELIIEGEAKTPGRELTRFTKLMTPGRSLWYGTLAFERLIFDEMQKMIDPGYAESFRTIERRAKNEFNQQFFSPPGSGFPPRRGPRLERALQ